MKPIYKPTGHAAEYADLALNIYTGCTNGCTYCYAPGVLRKTRSEFTRNVRVRDKLIESLRKQLAGGSYKGKTVHLCFTCDPYPANVDTMATRQVIEELKAAGCHVQILTKNPMLSRRDWDLLDQGDWVGTTFTGRDLEEPNAEDEYGRMIWLIRAKQKAGVRTWVSCEPVLDPEEVEYMVGISAAIDLFKFGKLNHKKSAIDYATFGRRIEDLCQGLDLNYEIKKSLREEMERDA